MWFTGWKMLSADPKHDPILKQVKSNLRRLFSRITFLSICIFLLWALRYQKMASVNMVQAILILTWGICFFSYVVVRTPFRSGMKSNAARLLADTILSSAYFVCAFSLIYSVLGINWSSVVEPDRAFDILDNLYFSAVTFSTLGYGDIQPVRASQGYAAIEAILGNLHLGMIVGATFVAITNTKK